MEQAPSRLDTRRMRQMGVEVAEQEDIFLPHSLRARRIQSRSPTHQLLYQQYTSATPSLTQSLQSSVNRIIMSDPEPSSTLPAEPHRKAIIGSSTNFWLHSSQTGFDLTHPENPRNAIPGPRLILKTMTSPITVDPSKSALIIIDMQNFFLSESFGRGKGAGHAACDALIKHALPAARKAEIRVIWLNWGLTDEDIKIMPAGVRRAFGFFAIPADQEFAGDGFGVQDGGVSVDKFGELHVQGSNKALESGRQGAMYRGLGADCGPVTLEDGTVIDAGRLLMRNMWNAALYPPLAAIYEEGKRIEGRPDVWIHKDRMSGMWGARTELEEYLEREGLRTLFLAGVNTDQCVAGTLNDAFSKGYDCVLLSDGCGTTSPDFAQQCVEFNAGRTFGFCTTCEELSNGVNKL